MGHPRRSAEIQKGRSQICRNIMRPAPEIKFLEPWHLVSEEAEQRGLQNELEKELSSSHPLWGTKPSVVGRHQACDDVLVALLDGRFAIVNLVWHGKVDSQPDKYPSTVVYENLAEAQKALDDEVADWA